MDHRDQKPKYPGCHVQLSGQDGNTFAIVGAVRKALRRHLADSMAPAEAEAEAAAFFTEATSGDYEHLLQTCMKWVDVA